LAAAEVAGKRRKKRKKKKKRKHPAQQAPPQQQPPAPPKYKHITGWDDSIGDGLVREVFEWVDQPPTDTPPPRPLPKPQDPPAPKAPQPMGVYTGTFGRIQATRLLNRAGFGPKRGEAVELAAKGLQAAVYSLTRPNGSPNLIGPDPVDGDGLPIAPYDAYGHDHLWWLDRMVRSDQQLVERMALILHDWFATSNDKVDNRALMLNQTSLFRVNAFGSFKTLLEQITVDPAMLLWLDGVENSKNYPNENYAREVMELFALGADRGAYTENDVRELARALTGWTYDWTPELGAHNFRPVSYRTDNTNKTVFGHTGNWHYTDIGNLLVGNPKHAEFLVLKLWSYFIPQPPSEDTKNALISLYNSSGYTLRPLLEAILMHPDFYDGPAMVKPPAVYVASLMRASGTFVHSEDWYWLAGYMGQQLFYPPNVSGWDDNRWLDTNTTRGRWLNAYAVLDDHAVDNWDGEYSATETPDVALEAALAVWDYPPLRKEQHNELLQNFAPAAVSGSLANWQKIAYRAMRQNGLRQLIAVSPDMQLS
jgi:uncharacterized protein (DUF1800 family)